MSIVFFLVMPAHAGRVVPPEEVCTDPLLLTLRTLEEGDVLMDQSADLDNGTLSASLVFEALDESSCDDWIAFFSVPWSAELVTPVDTWVVEGEADASITSEEGQLSASASGETSEEGSVQGEVASLDYVLETAWTLDLQLDENGSWSEAELFGAVSIDGDALLHSKRGSVATSLRFDGSVHTLAEPGEDGMPHGAGTLEATTAWEISATVKTQKGERHGSRSGAESFEKEFAF